MSGARRPNATTPRHSRKNAMDIHRYDFTTLQSIVSPQPQSENLENIFKNIDIYLGVLNEESKSSDYEEVALKIDAALKQLITQDNFDTKDEKTQEWVADRVVAIIEKLSQLALNENFANTEAFKEMIEYWYALLKNQYREFKDVSEPIRYLRLHLEEEVRSKIQDFVTQNEDMVAVHRFKKLVMSEVQKYGGSVTKEFVQDTIVPQMEAHLIRKKYLKAEFEQVILEVTGIKLSSSLKVSLGNLTSLGSPSPISGGRGRSASQNTPTSVKSPTTPSPLNIGIRSSTPSEVKRNYFNFGVVLSPKTPITTTPRGISTSPDGLMKKSMFRRSSAPTALSPKSPESKDENFENTAKLKEKYNDEFKLDRHSNIIIENVYKIFKEDINTKTLPEVLLIFEHVMDQFLKSKRLNVTVASDEYRIVFNSKVHYISKDFYDIFIAKALEDLKAKSETVIMDLRAPDAQQQALNHLILTLVPERDLTLRRTP
jgi:hypothetical protein